MKPKKAPKTKAPQAAPPKSAVGKSNAASATAAEHTHEPWQRTTLIATMGNSPAVLTETIWALAQRGIVPDDVVVISTTVGVFAVRKQLLDSPGKGEPSIWEDLLEALESEGHAIEGKLRFGAGAQHLIAYSRRVGKTMQERADIQDEADHEAMANCFIGELLKHTTDKNRIVVSIAGGFKTMSALMLSCLTLVARPWDRVNHVLVGIGYCPAFFFPKQKNQEIEWSDPGFTKKTKGCAVDVKILLLEVPLVTFRDLLEFKFQHHAVTYTDLIQVCRERVQKAAVLLSGQEKVQIRFLNDSQCLVEINGNSTKAQYQSYWTLKGVLEAMRDNSEESTRWTRFVDAADAAASKTTEWGVRNKRGGSLSVAQGDVSRAVDFVKKAVKIEGGPALNAAGLEFLRMLQLV